MNTNPFDGIWTYRSFLRDPDINTEFNDLRFGAGNLSIETKSLGNIQGSLGGTGWTLGLTGRCAFGSPFEIRFQGKGIIGGEEWIYDYHGFLAPRWPNGVGEVDSILGTIVRTVPHSNGQSEAGLVASWIAVRQ